MITQSVDGSLPPRPPLQDGNLKQTKKPMIYFSICSSPLFQCPITSNAFVNDKRHPKCYTTKDKWFLKTMHSY